MSLGVGWQNQNPRAAPSMLSCPEAQLLSVDFDTFPDGSSVVPGTYIDGKLGFQVSFERRVHGMLEVGNWARIFDSFNPTGLDPYLGIPSENCAGCIPAECTGFSAANGEGFLVANVTNCVTQINILIIHEVAVDGDSMITRTGGGSLYFLRLLKVSFRWAWWMWKNYWTRLHR
mmetsp:Transcript_51845/g.77402  ORF Transcript_51845/g.77402 Transcript_51845/m.77402 type:complete len:174 (+) Transcript_51845:1266-1787(+)